MPAHSPTDHPLDEYLESDVQRLLTEDVDVAEQGITVTRRENTLLICGEVESAARRDEIVRRIQQAYPGMHLECDIAIIRAQAPNEAEELS